MNSFTSREKVEVNLVFYECGKAIIDEHCASEKEKKEYMSNHHVMILQNYNFIDYGKVQANNDPIE